MDGSGGVWGNRGLERELAGFPFPTAADYAVKGPVPRLDVAQVPHGARAQDDVLEAGLCRVVVNARERLKHPRDEVAGQDHLALAVHPGVAGVLIPSFPDRTAALGKHVAPTRPIRAGRHRVSDLGMADVR